MKKRRKYFLFSVATVMVVLVMAEFGARVIYSFYYRGPEALMYGFRYTNLGAVVRAISKKRTSEWNRREKERVETVGNEEGIGPINSYGFVGMEFSVRKREETFRIVAMGGSTTQGKLERTVERTYPYTRFLQEVFDQERKKNTLMRKVEVINAGQAGMDLKGIYHRLKKKVLPLDPDLIILSSGWNNIVPFTRLALQSEQRVAVSVMTHLSRYSLFVVGMRNLTGMVFYGDPSHYWTRLDRAKISRAIANHPAFPSYKTLLWEVIRLLQEKTICLLLIRQPYKYRKSHFNPPNRLYYLYPIIHINEILDAASETFRIPAVNAEAFFNQIPEKRTLFTDVMHMTPEGYEKLARIVYRSILNHRLLEKRGCASARPDERQKF